MRGRRRTGELREPGRELDVVYVSHIDKDHISGVLALLENELEWRVHEHRKKNGVTDRPKCRGRRKLTRCGTTHFAIRSRMSTRMTSNSCWPRRCPP